MCKLNVRLYTQHTMDTAVYILSKYVFNLNCLFTWLQIRSVTHIKTFIQVIEKVLGKPENSLVKFNAWRIKVQEQCFKINVVRKGLNIKVIKDKRKVQLFFSEKVQIKKLSCVKSTLFFLLSMTLSQAGVYSICLTPTWKNAQYVFINPERMC